MADQSQIPGNPMITKRLENPIKGQVYDSLSKPKTILCPKSAGGARQANEMQAPPAEPKTGSACPRDSHNVAPPPFLLLYRPCFRIRPHI